MTWSDTDSKEASKSNSMIVFLKRKVLGKSIFAASQFGHYWKSPFFPIKFILVVADARLLLNYDTVLTFATRTLGSVRGIKLKILSSTKST